MMIWGLALLLGYSPRVFLSLAGSVSSICLAAMDSVDIGEDQGDHILEPRSLLKQTSHQIFHNKMKGCVQRQP